MGGISRLQLIEIRNPASCLEVSRTCRLYAKGLERKAVGAQGSLLRSDLIEAREAVVGKTLFRSSRLACRGSRWLSTDPVELSALRIA